jgi:hypothetical protein
MHYVNRSRRNQARSTLLAFLAAVLAVSIPGCSPVGGGATLSPADQEKAKQSFSKRFDDSGQQQKGRTAAQ